MGLRSIGNFGAGAGVVLAAALIFLPVAAEAQSPPAGSKAASASLAVPASIVRAAKRYLGIPYLHGGDSRQGLDCSGLIYRVYHDVLGMNLPRGVDALLRSGKPADPALHVGDLLFFDTDDNGPSDTATHVGVYAGGGRFVHAASEGARTGVIVSTLENLYYKERYLGARSVFPWRAPVLALTVTDEHLAAAETTPFASREPLSIEVYNGMSGGGPLDMTILKDGREILSRRIVPGSTKPAQLSLVPDIGAWTVRINRIFKGRELSMITFIVEE